jgi:hypothetical protein
VFPKKTGVRVVWFCPFGGSKSDVVPRMTPRPIGATLVVSWTNPVKLKLVRVIVDDWIRVPFAGIGRTMVVGLAEIAKSGRTVMMVRVIVWVFVNPLRVLLLVIVMLKVPRGVLEVVDTVRVDVPEPPEIVVVL